jgi:hypothetical protein
MRELERLRQTRLRRRRRGLIAALAVATGLGNALLVARALT